MGKPVDVIGKVFGMSKILKELERINGRRYVLCECLNCNIEHIKKLDDLRREDRPRTCGKCKYIKNYKHINEGENYFGYIVIREVEKKLGNRRVLVYDLDGFEKEVSYNSLIKGLLKKQVNTIIKHGMYKTRFYKIYRGILDRCNNENASHYKYYGGRGIKCEWNTFEDFKEDMYELYIEHCYIYGEADTTIDKINNNLNYCKENCRWYTKELQMNNTRKNIIIPKEFGGRTLLSICEDYLISRQTFYYRFFEKKLSFKECLGIKE